MGLLRSVKRRQGGLKSSGNVLPTTALGLLVFSRNYTSDPDEMHRLAHEENEDNN